MRTTESPVRSTIGSRRKACVGVIFAVLATMLSFGPTALPASAGNADNTLQWDDPTVDVCFENPTSATARERQIVQSAAAQWSQHADLRFVGWGTCVADADGIRILWADEAVGPRVRAIGSDLDRLVNGMILNRTFVNFCPDTRDCAADRNSLIWQTAVHEFGHALGIVHENLRADKPATCNPTNDFSRNLGNFTLGNWDLNSVMNYCNPIWNGGGRLSAGDIAMARTLYPDTPGGCDFWSGTHNLQDTRDMFPAQCGVAWHPERHRCDYTSRGWHCMDQ